MDTVEATRTAEQEHKFEQAKREQDGFTTAAEKRLLLWLAERTPEWINSDHLTAVGAMGMLLSGVSYAVTAYSQYGLLLSCVFLAVNWFGDSLDGTLARYRNRQRPRYGFYVDHVIDSFGAAALLGGMGISGYMHPLVAAWLLVSYLLLASEIFLASYALSRFQMSYLRLGPTELRLLLCAGNLYLFFRPAADPLGLGFTLFDFGGVVGAIGMGALAFISFVRHSRELYRQEPLP